MTIYNECMQLLQQGLHTMQKEYGEVFAIEQERCDLLARYCVELIQWQKRINLISKHAGILEIVEKHFLDSLTLLPYLQGENTHLLDIGSGAGFPGLVCKAALPGLSVSLLEPRSKRVSFLRHAARTMHLAEDEKYGGTCKIIKNRLEAGKPMPNDASQSFSHITARAVTDMASFIALIDGVMTSNDTTLLIMKGKKWQHEAMAAEEMLSKRAYIVQDVKKIQLPFSGATRSILEVRS